MYIDKAQKFDKENADNWDGQANGILLFVRSCSLPISLNIVCSRRSHFLVRHLLLHRSYFYRYQLPELAARSRRRPVRPRTDIRTACPCDHKWYQY